jgi:cell division protein FtsL
LVGDKSMSKVEKIIVSVLVSVLVVALALIEFGMYSF